MQELFETKESIEKLSLCLDSNSLRIKIAVYEILSTLCLVYGERGHQ